MKPLHAEMADAIAELKVWVELNIPDDHDARLAIWRAIGTLEKGAAFVRRIEEKP